MMHMFKKKNLLMAGIVVAILSILAVTARWSMQTAGADTGKAIETRNAKIREAFKMAEGR
ncbi:MAG: hypothetical protein QGH60_19610 [Phycisphaerae bacterium]|jgi:hypothetical protein|nr:hypothetical protein [Phycisphaerae bacterium]